MSTHTMEHSISRILRLGVLTSGALMLLGFVLLSIHGGAVLPPDPVKVFTNAPGLPFGRWLTDPMPYLFGGILVLMCTPIVRVAATLVMFMHEHDRRYVTISVIVLSVILVSIALSVVD